MCDYNLIHLPVAIRAWRWWCAVGPRDKRGGTIGGSFLMRRLRDFYRFASAPDRRVASINAGEGRTLFFDVLDLHFWHCLFPQLQSKDPELCLAQVLTPPEGVFIDAGANVGLISLFALQDSVAGVYSFEPSPIVWPVLQRTRDANEIGRASCRERV